MASRLVIEMVGLMSHDALQKTLRYYERFKAIGETTAVDDDIKAEIERFYDDMAADLLTEADLGTTIVPAEFRAYVVARVGG